MEDNVLALTRVQIHDATMADEADDDDDEEEPVLLGFLREPADRRVLLRHQFPSKAGGTPSWLDPLALPDRARTLCGICGASLRFLMQVYAPAEGVDYAFHRTIFVFICPRLSCLRQHAQQQRDTGAPPGSGCVPGPSVRAFRCQLALKNPHYAEVAPQVATPLPAGESAVLCDWCDTWRGDKRCGGCRRASYCSETHQKLHWRAGHAEICRQAQQGARGGGAIDGAVAPVETPSPPEVEEVTGGKRATKAEGWPELELFVEEEGEDEDILSTEGAASSGRKYSPPLAGGLTHDNFQDAEDDQGADKVQWAAFEARIGRAPEQGLRYCWSAKARPLWPRLDERPLPGGIPPCPTCGSPRIFEFQILPQLLYYMKMDDTDPEALDWSTLAIYSCEKSCARGGDGNAGGYVEELVWVQLAP